MGTPTRTQSAGFHFPDSVGFHKSWRQYQQRVLDSLDRYLEDRSIHVVAAPGSGKTVLGLEIVRRLDQPTLILAPTLTIRDQWRDRFVELFLPDEEKNPDWLTTNLKSPRFLTISTYQGLHALFTGNEESESAADEFEDAAGENGVFGQTSRAMPSIPLALQEMNFRTLVLDEAHHLRAEWWHVLSQTVEALESPNLVALTATPPYDVSPAEWERYQDLCGPIDAEVPIPELVQNRDLCPHQDLVYFTAPSREESNVIDRYAAGVAQLFRELPSNGSLLSAVSAHPWLNDASTHTEEVLENNQYVSSMLVLLNHARREIPRPVLEMLGVTAEQIPPFDLSWLEILLTGCIFWDAEHFAEIELMLKQTKKKLFEIGAIERRRVTLRAPVEISKLLTTSVTKLDAIVDIVRTEAATLGESLRLVVLTDYIRKSEMPKSESDIITFDDIGVVPIFERLRQQKPENVRIGVLTGSLAIIPGSAEARMRSTAAALGIRASDISMAAAKHDPGYSVLTLAGPNRQNNVRLLTQLFVEGEINVLVGTKSLLGEGWDAPAMNTLILASFVGSYMLSNQMRGRCIRMCPDQPDKTANIWHLVCVQPGLAGPGQDYELLCRRFKAFTGLSWKRAEIESGIERLNLGGPVFTRDSIAAINNTMRKRSAERSALPDRWRDGLAGGVRLAETLAAPPRSLPREFVFSNTIASVVLLAGAVAYQIWVLGAEGLRPQLLKGNSLLWYICVVLALAALGATPFLLKALWLFVKHGSLESSIRQLAEVVLQTLEKIGALRTERERITLKSAKDAGSVYCWIDGCTSRETVTFLRCLREVLEPVENPRYLLARRKKLFGFLREDYHAVPEAIAKRKDAAQVFAKLWNRKVGPAELVYTRSPEGRLLLLRARGHALATKFQSKCDRLSCWK